MGSQLQDLIYQCDRRADFSPRAHLCILTDSNHVTDALHVVTTDLVHTCLSNYFLPHRDGASVSWSQRKSLQQRMNQQTENQDDQLSAEYLEAMMRKTRRLRDTDAILFVNTDACAFLKTHRNSFLLTLATCLRSTTTKIAMLDISFKPINII